MATLAKRKVKNGDSIYIQFVLNGERKTLTLGLKYTPKQAAEIKLYIEKVVRCIETGNEPDKRTALWLDEMSDDLRERFTACGLIEKAKSLTVWELWDRFISDGERNPDLEESTVKSYGVTRNRFFRFFDKDALADEIELADAKAWREAMVDSGLAEATIAGTVKVTRVAFNWAVAGQYCPENVFLKLKRGSFVNREKNRFISMEWYRRLLDACPDQTWRTLLALCRIGALRNPSETLRLQWSDVNWEKSKIKITSPKTKRYKGHESRVIPMFPELREELERQFEQAEPGGSPYVIDRWRDTAANLRTHFERIIFRAGLAQWPELFQNLRRSRDNELSSDYPAHVAAEWMGHSPKVAIKHYLFATDTDFDRATTPQKGENGPKNAETASFGIGSTAFTR